MIPLDKNHDDRLRMWYGDRIAALKGQCEKCAGEGIIMADESTGSECECIKQGKFELKMLRGNVPEEYWQEPEFNVASTFPSIKDYLVQLGESRPKGLMLAGSNGTGKTTKACYVLRRAARAGMGVFRIEAPEIVRVQSMVRSGAYWADMWLQTGMFQPVVSIDEMGSEFGKSFTGGEIRTLMAYFIKHRSENNLPTIICTNMSFKAFKEAFGESISSVVHGNKFVAESLIEADWRQQ